MSVRRRFRPCAFAWLACVGFGVGLASLWPGRAAAYPYMDIRPGGQIFSGPTDGQLGALHFNPAAIRLRPGSQVMAVAGANGYVGSYQRSTPLPAGFSPDNAATTAASANIGWANPNAMVAASWDLRSDAVTLGFGFYTPHMDFSNYSAGRDASSLGNLATRYHLVAAQTYALWGTVAVGLRIKPWFYFGGGFNFAYTRSQSLFFRDLDAKVSDDFSCGSTTGCEQWQNRMAITTDVGNWGYGFSTGALFVPLPDRLFIGISYTSPLFTGRGDEVGLGGLPDRAPWQGSQGSDGCVGSPLGVQVTRGEQLPQCGSALQSLAYPHIFYLGLRGRIGVQSWARYSPSWIELTGWARLTIPPRDGTELNIDKRIFPQGLLALPLSLRPAVAVTFGVRQHWRWLTLGEELLFESSRTDPAAVSPANLEGHKLDLSLGMRLRLGRRLALVLTVGATYVLFSGDAGTKFNPNDAGTCRAADYDITQVACQLTQGGWSVPPAPGSYQLVIPHGVAGFELNL